MRFIFNLIRFTNRAESVNPWNLIITTSFSAKFLISLVLFFCSACLLGLNRTKAYIILKAFKNYNLLQYCMICFQYKVSALLHQAKFHRRQELKKSGETQGETYNIAAFFHNKTIKKLELCTK